jgi:hypothetical protein
MLQRTPIYFRTALLLRPHKGGGDQNSETGFSTTSRSPACCFSGFRSPGFLHAAPTIAACAAFFEETAVRRSHQLW